MKLLLIIIFYTLELDRTFKYKNFIFISNVRKKSIEINNIPSMDKFMSELHCTIKFREVKLNIYLNKESADII